MATNCTDTGVIRFNHVGWNPVATAGAKVVAKDSIYFTELTDSFVRQAKEKNACFSTIEIQGKSRENNPSGYLDWGQVDLSGGLEGYPARLLYSNLLRRTIFSVPSPQSTPNSPVRPLVRENLGGDKSKKFVIEPLNRLYSVNGANQPAPLIIFKTKDIALDSTGLDLLKDIARQLPKGAEVAGTRGSALFETKIACTPKKCREL